MTDPTPADAAEPNMFTSVVTGEAFMQFVNDLVTLRDHVDELQAGQPATSDEDTDTDGSGVTAELATLSGRIDRHRAEIENIKTVINQLIRFLGSDQTPIPRAAQDATGDTITASSTGGL